MNHPLEPTYVGVLDLADDLAGVGVVADEAVHRARLLAVELEPGPVETSALQRVPGAHGLITGFMVLSGTLLADITLAGRTATQLLGPGDLVPGAGEPDGPLAVAHRLTAESRATVAVLDERLLAVSQRWPAITARVLEAGIRQLERAAVHQAISQLSRVELRLLALMHHLAGRWGRVTSEGFLLNLDLTHAMLGQLVGARRPTVSLALKWLSDEGLLSRRDDGAWLIAREASDLLTAGPDPQVNGRFVLAPVTDTALEARQDGASA